MELTRRGFIKIGFAVASAAALAGCGRPVEHDFVSQFAMPEYRVPGVPVFFATTCGECRNAHGVAVRVMHGRANHLAGIPTHPVSRGKMCNKGFSALQALYHPDRLTMPLIGGKPGDWKAVAQTLADRLKARNSLWIVRRISGSEGAFLGGLAASTGSKIWVLDFPTTRAERMAMKAVAGRAALPYDDLANSDYVVNFGGDPLANGHNEVEAQWSYGQMRTERRPEKYRGVMVTFSTRMNMTAASSDKWVPVRPGGEAWAALGLVHALAAEGRGKVPAWASKFKAEDIARHSGVEAEVFTRVAKRLLLAKNPLVVGGEESAASREGVSALRLIYGINRLLGRPVETFEPDLLVGGAVPAGVLISSEEALKGLKTGMFKNLFTVDVDPAYLVPKAYGFEEGAGKAMTRTAFASFQDDTTKSADLVVPTSTWLESWGDLRVDTPEGPIYGLRQPAVVARDGSRGFLEVLLEAARAAGVAGTAPDTVVALLQKAVKKEAWEDLLVRGGIWRSEDTSWEPYTGHNPPLNPPPAIASPGGPPVGVNPWSSLPAAAEAPLPEPAAADPATFTLIPYASMLGDGRYSNRPWMLEFPDPLTTVTWENFVEVNTATAQRLGITAGDLVTLKSPAGDVTLPAVPTPGIHPEAVAVAVGYGRNTPGHWSGVGTSVSGVLAAEFQSGSGEIAWNATKVSVNRASGSKRLTILDQRVNGLPRRVLPH